MRRNRSRFSSTGRFRYGLSRAWLGQRAAVLPDLVGAQAVDVRLAVPDQRLGAVVERLEVVGGVVEPVVPREPEPPDVLLNRLDVFDVLGDRVGVVEAQVAGAAEVPGDAEIEADRFRVADVEVAIRFRREARGDAAAVLPRCHVGSDDFTNEIEPGAGLGCRRRRHKGIVDSGLVWINPTGDEGWRRGGRNAAGGVFWPRNEIDSKGLLVGPLLYSRRSLSCSSIY